MFRLSVERLKDKNILTAFYKQQRQVFRMEQKKSHISNASSGLTKMGLNTVIPHAMLEQYQTASLEHLRQVSDYLELGQGVWYSSDDTAITFFDGADCPESRPEGPVKMHFRYGEHNSSFNAKNIFCVLRYHFNSCLQARRYDI